MKVWKIFLSPSQNPTAMIKNLKYFISCFDAELLKTRRTFAIWMAVISPLFIALMFFLVYLFEDSILTMLNTGNPWATYIDQHYKAIATFMLPFFVVLLTTLVVYTDHKNNTWKLLYTMPVPKWCIYYSKLFTIAFLVFLTHVLFLLLILFSGFLLGIFRPELGFGDFAPAYLQLVVTTINSFLATLGIITIQFWISMRVKNLFVPLGIGLICIVAGNILILAFFEEIIYIPYAHPSINSWEIIGSRSIHQFFIVNEVGFYGLIYFFIVSFLFYLDVRRMNVK